MYDTVKITLNTTGLDLVDTIYKHMGTSFNTTTSNGQTSYWFNPENLYVYVNDSRITVCGSFCKYLHGNNLVNFTREDMKLATEKLNDTFHISFEDAKVTQIDFAYNFDVSLPVESYYYHLGDLPYYKRLENSYNRGVEGLYYSCTTDKKKLVFYDKLKEMRFRGATIPAEYADKNILRYEMKLLKSPAKILGYDKITLDMLSEKGFYNSVLDYWKTNYSNIEKLHDIAPNLTEFSGFTEIKNLALLDYINRNGGMIEFLKMVDNQYKKGIMLKRNRDELKKQAKKLANRNLPPEIPDTAIYELNNLVKSV